MTHSTEKLKIFHVIDSGGLYGAEVVLLNLMLAQQALGLKPQLVSIGTPENETKPVERRAAALSLPVFPVRMSAGLNFVGACRLLRLSRGEEGPVLLHSHGYKGNILLGLLPMAWRRQPLVTTLHGWTWTGQLSRMMVYEWFDALSLRLIDHVVLVNEKMAEHPRLRVLPQARRSVICNGISPIESKCIESAIYPESIREFCQRRFTILGVGRLSKEKNFTSLVRVTAALVREDFDLQLILLGEGRGRDELTALAANEGIVDRVLMPGYVEDVGTCMADCRIFAMPSLTEGLPIALLEAMQAGIPIVATRVGGIPSALAEGECGLLVSSGDDEELKNAIFEIYRNPDAARTRAGLASRRVRENYSSNRMAQEYLDVYQRVLTGIRA
ncbi:Glycosyltransferase, YqgM-like family [Desulfosarcina cetonica]|uniref:glycosyltransferase n=1 Tax=Desulfosarcina cetonica TaxID=90730 RepID=UPI0006CF9C58|nr:glycosyltransferase [Desulfosarcina cetonica]VTR64152.1 Glycosyltransferase, YqgM-like family [Desulfosarcina cetonica]